LNLYEHNKFVRTVDFTHFSEYNERSLSKNLFRLADRDSHKIHRINPENGLLLNEQRLNLLIRPKLCQAFTSSNPPFYSCSLTIEDDQKIRLAICGNFEPFSMKLRIKEYKPV
jgi:hypothetical protein